MSLARVAGLTTLAMLAFAANSILCRLALGQGAIDAGSFTAIRTVSGAVMLLALLSLRSGRLDAPTLDARGAAALSVYLIGFSFAYVSLETGVGALILFGVVQLTMIGAALRAGERFSGRAWAGVGAAILGLVVLAAPGAAAPNPFGAILMAAAGLGWGVYSLLGRGATDPLAATASNFVYAAPLAAASLLLVSGAFHVSPTGALLAAASGALASGCGYAIWYAVLPTLGAGRAATVQLTVPAIAAFGGVLLLNEALTLRLLLASALMLGGVGVFLSQRARGAT